MIRGFLIVLGGFAIIAAFLCLAALIVAGRERRVGGEQWEERDAGLGDPSTVPPDEPTQIYDALAAERVIASADAVVAAEWDRADEVYDVDDWPGAS